MNPTQPQRRLTLSGLAGLREAGAPVRERLMTMLFLAGIAHGIVILGLSFGTGGRSAAAPGMEVLLVTEDLPEAHRNDQAAYLAQRTQLGSGNTRRQGPKACWAASSSGRRQRRGTVKSARSRRVRRSR